jgi:hypothetical protein
MPRRRVTDRWPWPAESVLERREHLARIYRDKLMEVAPEACLQLDADAVRFGQGWITPKIAIYEPDDLLTAADVADHAGVQPRTVDLWVGRGLRSIRTPDGLRFRFGDVLEFQASRRVRRAVRRGGDVRGTADVPLPAGRRAP